MADHSDVVNRADSFMRSDGNPDGINPLSAGGRRRRSFLASPPNPHGAAPVAAPWVAIEDDDLPVLTEIVPIETDVFEDQGFANTEQPFDENQIAILASDIAHAIGQQMAYELPTLLEATLINASEELRAGITATMETALRDYLARRKQLSLPLDEPDNEK